eukprot:16432792-Heterocapsa_arctica.AAC.1
MAIARMPEDRSKTFKNLQKPSKTYAPSLRPRALRRQRGGALPLHQLGRRGRGDARGLLYDI